jgi:hypothetical protein
MLQLFRCFTLIFKTVIVEGFGFFALESAIKLAENHRKGFWILCIRISNQTGRKSSKRFLDFVR